MSPIQVNMSAVQAAISANVEAIDMEQANTVAKVTNLTTTVNNLVTEQADLVEKVKSITSKVNELSTSEGFVEVLADVTSLIYTCYGTFMGWAGTTIPILEAEDSPVPLTADEGSWLASINSLTMLVTIFAAGYAVDVVGRKKVALFGAGPFVIWWLIVAFADSYGMLLAARAIGSLGAGAIITALPVFLCEIADTDLRGTLIVIHYILMQCGTLLVYCIGPYLSITTVALICTSIPIIFVLTFIWMPESPYFFLTHHREAEAVKCLERLKGQLTPEELKFELELLYKDIREKQQNKGKFTDVILVPVHRRTLLLAIGFILFQMSAGSTALTTYTTYIFEKSGSELDSNISSIILTVVTLGANVASSLVVERFDRRPLCMATFSACAICLAAEGAYFYVDDIYGDVPTAFDWVPLAGMIGFNISFSIGPAPVLSLFMGELFHVSVKGIGVAIGTVVIALYGFFLKKMFQVVSDGLGAYYSFWGFTVITARVGLGEADCLDVDGLSSGAVGDVTLFPSAGLSYQRRAGVVSMARSGLDGNIVR
ncbi:facilitated trehalose transporter Tret1-like [Schistocerca serialis cubense]|uniref:facilitated trehalose transporter Tret1-like n=1 Tax=Schistocerca serialis cubense TaxID=2023355 RepID=UPI00214F044B|nr:facilitated trehalose transporter Tret1-like [Schistocerca serialis cubense]